MYELTYSLFKGQKQSHSRENYSKCIEYPTADIISIAGSGHEDDAKKKTKKSKRTIYTLVILIHDKMEETLQLTSAISFDESMSGGPKSNQHKIL